MLELMILTGIGKGDSTEHKHYWNKKEIYNLAEKSGFVVEKYTKFQLGFNQLAVFKHK